MSSYQGVFSSKDALNYTDEVVYTEPDKIKVQHFVRMEDMQQSFQTNKTTSLFLEDTASMKMPNSSI